MCDTFIRPIDGGFLFAKNSDREANEAQALEYHPPADFPAGATLECTYKTVGQVPHTRGVILSRPFWMWGAEIGVNDAGVVIGNEAVFTKEPLDLGATLTGMDLLRLALERADTARQALDTITDLLEVHGQGGVCGYTDKRFSYHNSYIIADSNEAWVLEAAGYYWAALKIDKAYSISNGLTLERDLTLHHPELITHALEKKYVKNETDFSFASTYSDWLYTRFSSCSIRRARTGTLMASASQGVENAFAMLRDHQDPEQDTLRGFHHNRVCAHAAGSPPRKSGQSTGSLVVALRQGRPPEVWATGTSAPCTGIFKPVIMAALPETVGSPGAEWSDESLWWRHEVLHREVIRNYQHRLPTFRAERDELEASFVRGFAEVEEQGSAAQEQFVSECFKRADEVEANWLGKLPSTKSGSHTPHWRRMNARAGMPKSSIRPST